MNTIASSFPGLNCLISELHRWVMLDKQSAIKIYGNFQVILVIIMLHFKLSHYLTAYPDHGLKMLQNMIMLRLIFQGLDISNKLPPYIFLFFPKGRVQFELSNYNHSSRAIYIFVGNRQFYLFTGIQDEIFYCSLLAVEHHFLFSGIYLITMEKFFVWIPQRFLEMLLQLNLQRHWLKLGLNIITLGQI